MDSMPIQRLFPFLILFFLDVAAFNITVGTTNDSTVSLITLQEKHGAMNQTYLKFNDSKIGNISWHEVTMGKSVLFDCDASGNPTPTIIWQKYGRPLQEVSYRSESLVPYSSFHLQLDYVLPPDSGNYTCIVVSGNTIKTRLFILNVLEKKETAKPKIKSFVPQNLTAIVGAAVHLQCVAESQFNDTLPFMKLVKYINVSDNAIATKSVNITKQLQREVAKIIRKGTISPYAKKNYEIIRVGDSFIVMETMKLVRSLSVNYIIDQVEMTDDAIFSCTVFNTVGLSRKTIHLHVIPPAKPSLYELAVAYASKFGGHHFKQQIPLAVTVCLPVAVLIILTIGFIWWKENLKTKLKEEKLSLIKIKKLRELDNFSSLEHMEKFSSRMETKRSSFVSEGVGSEIVEDDSFGDDLDCDERLHDRLLGNGHTKLLSAEDDRKVRSGKTPEVIQLHDLGPTSSETPLTGRSSAFGSNGELEWEPVDLKLKISPKSEVKTLDSSD